MYASSFAYSVQMGNDDQYAYCWSVMSGLPKWFSISETEGFVTSKIPTPFGRQTSRDKVSSKAIVSIHRDDSVNENQSLGFGRLGFIHKDCRCIVCSYRACWNTTPGPLTGILNKRVFSGIETVDTFCNTAELDIFSVPIKGNPSGVKNSHSITINPVIHCPNGAPLIPLITITIQHKTAINIHRPSWLISDAPGTHDNNQWKGFVTANEYPIQ